LQIIAWLRGRVAMTVTHYECDPNRGASSYRIGIESALTLEQWCAWALHLHQKSWMGKRDSFLFMELWFTNRKIDYSDLTLAGLDVGDSNPAVPSFRLQLRQ
jgi:hypothetical protein